MSLRGSPIFTDRNKLSPYYIPKCLRHRDDQMQRLHAIYGETVKNVENAYPRYTQIIGNTGTGKTCTTLKFGEAITAYAEKEGVNLQHVYVNCKVDGTTRFVLFGNLVRKVTTQISTRSLSPEEMIRQLIEYLRVDGRRLIITFDEIDYFVQTNPREHIIYDLTRIPEMHPGEPPPVIGEIFIARSLKWHSMLEPSEKSTLGMGIIEFPRYTARQIRDILEERIAEAFCPNAVNEETLGLISDITANPPVNGDLRVGLELLYYAGTLAENTGSKSVLPDHVRKVYSETNPTVTSEDITNLDETNRLILLAFVQSLQANRSAYIGLRDAKLSYEVLCEEHGAKPTEKFEEHLQDLIHRGIVEMKSLTELGITGASLTDLEKFLNNLTQQLRQDHR